MVDLPGTLYQAHFLSWEVYTFGPLSVLSCWNPGMWRRPSMRLRQQNDLGYGTHCSGGQNWKAESGTAVFPRNPIQTSHGVTPSKTLHFVREKQTSLLLKTLSSVSLILAAAVLTDTNISQLSLSCLICDVHITLDGYIRFQMILSFYKFIFNSVLFSITYFLVGQMDFSSVLCNYSTFISSFNVSTKCQH